jgi:hypothetical protein
LLFGPRNSQADYYDELAMSKPSRLTVWMVLIGTVVVLLVTFLLVVPFRRVDYYLDRRLGMWSASATWCGVLTLEHPVVSQKWLDPNLLTAESRTIHFGHAVQRYAWSPISRIQPNLPDVWYWEAFYHLFAVMSRKEWAELPGAQRDFLLRERIALWNSSQLDHQPKEIAVQAQAENAKLTGRRAAGYFVNAEDAK